MDFSVRVMPVEAVGRVGDAGGGKSAVAPFHSATSDL
ncbi:hypothetical protein SSE37_04470 [Sagittula stellata E-37]|uniref:Uncharacterized protein n=1 Tax=Sagittula stellata (strain ATCC 700073 / DSM 11524 / E-37) TaxID=388399 RepID=A3K1S4_SAGS3|nr:hypothetical protein SSE37_04470 [Sagittula stellata E-37]